MQHYSIFISAINPKPLINEVAYEYAKVRWFYAQYGLSNMKEFLDDGHTINVAGTFNF